MTNIRCLFKKYYNNNEMNPEEIQQLYDNILLFEKKHVHPEEKFTISYYLRCTDLSDITIYLKELQETTNRW